VLVSDFDYILPPELIAQQPLPDRAGARMLVVDRKTGTWQDRQFRDLPAYLQRGDCLVLNNSRVFPSRLLGKREKTGGNVEVFLVRPVAGQGNLWQALVRPGRSMRVGERVVISDALSLEVFTHGEFGERTVKLNANGDLHEILERIGHIPLPPYISRDDSEQDRERYQTVFAQKTGSVAAPTAGLHFTPEVLGACRDAGAEIAHVALHVGLGTFQRLRAENLADVQLHAEAFTIPDATLQAMSAASRVMAVGTTSVRAIESVQDGVNLGDTRLFISPGFRFQRTGALLTNFHLPKSSLLILVSAFAGRELILEAYAHALVQRYRFFSYGDCMLIL
jgi:S-adenosylmethionine:tRNA ribosyltransferase-isomerase